MIDCHEQFLLINERHPRIGEKIKELWGTTQCNFFMNDLLNDKRDTHREGFSRDVASAIFKLIQAHEKQFPDKVVEAADIWTLNNEL